MLALVLRLGSHASLRPCYAEILPRTRLTLASLAKVRGPRSGLREADPLFAIMANF